MATDSSAVIQQDGKKHVSGVVKDKSGAPVPGASVMIPNTTVGTITGPDGSYSLDVPSGTTVLEVVSMGYTTAQITLGAASVYNVVIEEDTVSLDEVVFVGYGTQKKKSITILITGKPQDTIRH